MRFVRRIPNSLRKLVDLHFSKGEATEKLHHSAMLALFGDEKLSVYQVEDDDSALMVAAALNCCGGGVPSKSRLLSVSDEELKSIGFTPRKTIGETCFSPVDDCHYEVSVKSTSDMISIAGIFLSGDIYSFEVPEIRAAMIKIATSNFVNLSAIASSSVGSSKRNTWVSFVHLASDAYVELREPV